MKSLRNAEGGENKEHPIQDKLKNKLENTQGMTSLKGSQ